MAAPPGGPAIGTPSPRPGVGSISTPPGGGGVKSATIRFDHPPQPHIEPAPYDAAKDPAWKQWLVHGGEEFRNLINSMDDGARQMLHGVLTSVQSANPLQQAANALVPPGPTAAPASPFPGAGFTPPPGP
jgi:hypothetical protein